MSSDHFHAVVARISTSWVSGIGSQEKAEMNQKKSKEIKTNEGCSPAAIAS